jgi:hypothetical protein
MNLKRRIFVLATLLTLVLCVPSAHATLALSLSTNGTIGSGATVFITDGGAGDTCAAANCIIWVGGVGSWWLTVNTGEDKDISAPLLMHLNSIDNHCFPPALSCTNEALTIALSDNDFTPATGGVNSHIGGTLSNGGTFSSTAYYDPTNSAALFQTGAGTTPLGTLNGLPPSFSGDLSKLVPSSSPYGLTIVTTMNFGAAAGNGSFDSTLDPVPEPSSVALLGGVLLATATVLRRKLRRS